MPINTPIRLSQQQLALLKLLYKFRYVSVQTLTTYTKNSESTIKQKLNALIKHNLISRRYAKLYRLQGRPAIYYLKPSGIKYLQTHHSVSEQVASIMRKNPYRTQELMDKHIAILRLVTEYRHAFPEQRVLTRYEILQFSSFPNPRPDIYIYQDSEKADDVFIYYINNERFVELKKLVNKIIEHYDSDEWQNDSGASYPEIQIIIESSKFLPKLQQYIAQVLESNGIDELVIAAKSSNDT